MPDRVIRLAFIRGTEMEQFTANEVRTESCKQGQLHRQPASDMLNAFADLLEAREKAVPVVWVSPDDLANPYFVGIGAAKEAHQDLGKHYTLPLYTQSQPPAASVTDAMADMYWLDSDPEHLSFDSIPSALEYVEGDDITTVTLQRARKLPDINVPVRFNSECGTYEIDEAALAAQENPNG
jgi:hypothetical protein